MEVRLLLYKVFSEPRYSIKIVPIQTKYVFKKGATILRWSAQSKLCIVLDPTCNDPVLQTSWISTKVATHVSHKILWKPDAKPVQHKVRNI